MRYLATRKIDLAGRLGSRALRTDAVESITCGWLSVVAVVSLGAQQGKGRHMNQAGLRRPVFLAGGWAYFLLPLNLFVAMVIASPVSFYVYVF